MILNLFEILEEGEVPVREGDELVGKLVIAADDPTITFPAGAVTIVSPASGVVPLTVKGASGQAVPLQTWRTSADAIVASVDAAGTFQISGHLITTASVKPSFIQKAAETGSYIDINGGGFGANIGVIGRDPAGVTWAVKGATAQSANLQQWETNAGVLRLAVEPSGRLTWAGDTSLYRSSANSLATSGDFYTAGLVVSYLADITAGAAAQVPLRVHSAVGQTANLVEYQDSGGGVFAYVDSAGGFATKYLQGYTATGAYLSWVHYSDGIMVVQRNPAAAGLIVSAAAAQTALIQSWQNSTGATLASVAADGKLQATESVYIDHASFAGIYPRSSVDYVARSRVGATPADGMLYYDAGIAAAGGAPHAFRSGSSYQTRMLIGDANGASVALDVRGVTGQSGELQIWRADGGGVVASVSSAGIVAGAAFNTSGGMTFGYAQSPSLTGAYIQFDSASLQVIQRNPVWDVLTVQGAAAQTSPLQKWLNSAGGTVALVSAGGSFTGDSYTSSNESGFAGVKSTYYQSNLATGAYIQFVSNALQITQRDPAAYVLNISAAPSQATHLQTWQASGGTLLAYVNAGGGLGVPNLRYPDGSGTVLSFQTGNAAVFTVQNPAQAGLWFLAAPAQSAHLTQWLSSAYGTMAYVRSDGAFYSNVFGGVDPAGVMYFGDTADTSYINVRRKILMGDGKEITFGTATGSRIGAGNTEKLAFWGATPVVRPATYGAPTGTPTRTTFVTSSVTLPQLAERVKAMIDDLRTIGLLG